MIGPDGTTVLASTSTDRYHKPVELDDVLLGEAGTHTIRVTEVDDYEISGFTVGLSDQPSAEAIPLPAFNTKITDNMEYQILAAYPFSGFTFKHYLDSFWNLEPAFAGRHGVCKIS